MTTVVVLGCPLDREVDRLGGEPHAWQALSVPCDTGTTILDDPGLTHGSHRAVLQLAQVSCEKRQAVGGMAQEVGLHEQLSDDLGAVRR